MFRQVVAYVLFNFLMQCLQAQQADTVHLLKGVEIQAERISVFQPGIKIEKFDSTIYSIRQGVSVATLLSEQSPVFLRSFGPGGISTMSVRGTASTQSGVFWNGINLNQPNIGMTDLSRISTFDFNDLAVRSGGGSSISGSGMIGGSLQLANQIQFSAPLQVSVLLSAGSAGKLTQAVKASAGSHRFAFVSSLSKDYNRNNFWFTDDYGNRKRVNHALVNSVSTIHQAEAILSKKQRLSAGIWVQATDRQIPPTMTMAKSDQQQSDIALRSSLQWTFMGNKQSFVVRSAYLVEKEHFESPIATIDAHYLTKTCYAELEYKRNLGNHFDLGSGITGSYILADVTDYKDTKSQKEGSARIALVFRQSDKGIKAVVNLRQDVIEGYRLPFCPSVSAEMPLSRFFTMRFACSHNFRVPAMNDRFWIPGGNPGLLPESSWNQEAGISYDYRINDFLQSKISCEIYNILIDNYIQWIPGNSGFWSPQNINKVWSRGADVSVKTDWNTKSFKGYFSLAYNYSPSTDKQNLSANNNKDTKQLIYMPLHKMIVLATVSYGKYYAMLSNSFTGKRYVQTDNFSSLPAFFVSDFYAGRFFKVKHATFRFQVEARNMLNAQYQSVQYYPEPGRSFIVQLITTLNQ